MNVTDLTPGDHFFVQDCGVFVVARNDVMRQRIYGRPQHTTEGDFSVWFDYELVEPTDMKKETFESGAQRDSAKGKGRYADVSAVAMKRLANRLELGAEHYEALNYQKGMPLLRSMDSTLRHLYQYLGGDRSEDHLAAAMFGCMAMMHTEELIENGHVDQSFNDLPFTTEPLNAEPYN